jgi:hypothetical protein
MANTPSGLTEHPSVELPPARGLSSNEARRRELESEIPTELWLGREGYQRALHTFTTEKEAVTWMAGCNPFSVNRCIWAVRIEVLSMLVTTATVERLKPGDH